MKKFELYMVSLTLLFLFVVFLTFPVCFGKGCEFISFQTWIFKYWFVLLNIGLLLTSLYLLFSFSDKLKNSHNTPFKIVSVKNISYEHLTFLVTYIIPLVAFDFGSDRYKILFLALVFLIGVMYIKTDLFYSNPSFALLGFSIYQVNASFRGDNNKDIVVLSRSKLSEDNQVAFLKLTDKVYIGKKL